MIKVTNVNLKKNIFSMENNCSMSTVESVCNSPVIKTPKSQKQVNSDARRWASVVKTYKNILNSPETNKFTKEQDEEPLCIFSGIPRAISGNNEEIKDFVNNSNNLSFCQICSLELDTPQNLSNHMKTRKHEDNVIVYLKEILPAHLEHTVEFVSFYKSNLCCNLCQETIDMSLNPHETILNIIAHNTDTTHASLRTSQSEHKLAHSLLASLAELDPEIKENVQYINKKIVPHFMCKICSKHIFYNENVKILQKKLFCHFKSLEHIRNRKAVEVLKLFDEVSVVGKESFSIADGDIICSICQNQVDSTVEMLLLHVKGVEHTIKYLAKFNFSSEKDEKVKIGSVKENETSILTKSVVSNNKFKMKETNKENVECEESVNSSAKLNSMLSTLQTDLRQVDCLIKNNKGSVTCLICNCLVPPCKHNIEIHLNGNNHQRKKLELENKEPSLEVLSSKQSRKSLTRKLKNISFIVRNKSGFTECLVCQSSLPSSLGALEEHLESQGHNEMEIKWLKRCPGCANNNDKFLNEILKIPKELRVYQCRSINNTDLAAGNDIYDFLLQNNITVSKNSLVANVDGKHCYCKPCKSLIPLSSNTDELIKNLVSHFKGINHGLKGLKNCKKNSLQIKTQSSPSTGKVVRSLFALSKANIKDTKDTTVDVKKEFTTSKDLKTIQSSKLKRKSAGALETLDKTKKTSNRDIFVFGKPDNSKQCELENCKNSQKASKSENEHKALPVKRKSRLSMFDIETDEVILSRRQKQLDYGKNTEGYCRYRKALPLAQRLLSHPWTPPKHIKCSRRNWDGLVKAWRKRLHAWDDPQSDACGTLDQDIQPLSLSLQSC